MRYTYEKADTEVWYVSGGKEQPTLYLRADRDPDDHGMRIKTFPSEWWVLGEALSPNLHQEQVFNKTLPGVEIVRIPLFSYTTTSDAAEVLFATGVQAGLQAMTLFPANRVVERAHMVIGDAYLVEDQVTEEDRYQVWLGLGFQLAPQ